MENQKENSSEFWMGSNDYGSWNIYWNTKEAQNDLFINRKDFFNKYYLLTQKYGLLLPTLDFFREKNKTIDIVDYIFQQPDVGGVVKWLRLLNMYYVDFLNILAYPSVLFFKDKKGNIKNEILVDINRMTNVNNIDNNALDEPLKISVWVSEKSISIDINLKSNAFFEKITKRDNTLIDNLELAYLNTPRLNSFLRDFTSICFEFGATNLEFFSELGEKQVSTSGIFLQKEILFYEDIFNLINKEYQYDNFEKIHLEIDQKQYNRYIDSLPK